MLRLFLVLVLAGLAGAADANLVGDMRVIGDTGRTRFIVDLERNPEFRILRLSNPYRLVIDMPEVEFGDPAMGEGRGLISDYRYGLIAAGEARIVLDLAQPVEIVSTFVLDPVPPEPARLVIDVVPTSAETFEAAALNDRPSLEAASPGPERAPVEAEGRPIVVIDAGHGGIDSGAVGADQLLEKDVTLEFALELAEVLRESGKVEPVLTRDGDDFISLPGRVEIARDNHAAFFISIHADSVAEDYVRGATVYTLSDDASDALSAALAARENRSDILAGLALEDQPDDVADILFDLARRESRNLSIRFATALVEDIDGALPLNSNPWRRGAFRVLMAPEVPSVLLELGYLSNEEDEELFRSAQWPEREAAAVAKAIEEFFGRNVTAGQ
jgi:N-acetylmuramoyl-L-alanine amidase